MSKKEDLSVLMTEGNHLGTVPELPDDYNFDDESSDFEQGIREEE